jgi:hypothetical protein
VCMWPCDTLIYVCMFLHRTPVMFPLKNFLFFMRARNEGTKERSVFLRLWNYHTEYKVLSYVFYSSFPPVGIQPLDLRFSQPWLWRVRPSVL